MIMVYQQYTTAIKTVYKNDPNVAKHAETAEACRVWLESLRIDPHLRTPLVEQIQTLEEAFKDLLLPANNN